MARTDTLISLVEYWRRRFQSPVPSAPNGFRFAPKWRHLCDRRIGRSLAHHSPSSILFTRLPKTNPSWENFLDCYGVLLGRYMFQFAYTWVEVTKKTQTWHLFYVVWHGLNWVFWFHKNILYTLDSVQVSSKPKKTWNVFLGFHHVLFDSWIELSFTVLYWQWMTFSVY